MKQKINSSDKKKEPSLALSGKSSGSLFDLKTFKKDVLERKPKIDHTYLFNKWKDLKIDPKKLREETW